MATTLLLAMPGGSEWILIVLIVLLIFGGKKIPELMKGVGRGIREYKDAKDKMDNETGEPMNDQPPAKKETVLSTGS